MVWTKSQWDSWKKSLNDDFPDADKAVVHPTHFECADDCYERTNCKIFSVGHIFCGRRKCGHPKHHPCEHSLAEIFNLPLPEVNYY